MVDFFSKIVCFLLELPFSVVAGVSLGFVVDFPVKAMYFRIFFPRLYINSTLLKVHKRENFLLAFLALSEPTWVIGLGSGKKIEFFSYGLWFFAAY
jgi:hypothetical protein